MKKHILGIAVFAFVVSATIVFSSFVLSKKEVLIEEEMNLPVYSGDDPLFKNACSLSSIEVIQSEFDLNSKKIKTLVRLLPIYKKNDLISLHFFAKDGDRTRYVTTSKFVINSDFNYVEKIIITSAEEIGYLAAYEDIYVIPAMERNTSVKSNSFPEFYADSAVSVVIAKGKRQ